MYHIKIKSIFKTLYNNRKFIIIFTSVCSIIAVLYSLFATQYWTSSISFKMTDTASSSIPFNSAMLSSISSSFLGDQTLDLDTYIAILTSRDFKTKIINEFKLIDYFKITKKDTLQIKELAIKSLKNEYRVELNKETDIITINSTTKDKYLSYNIVNYAFNYFDHYNRVTKKTKGREERIFLEVRIKEVNTKIDSLSKAIVEFQKKNNSIELTEQTKASLEIYSSIVAEKTKNEIEYEYLKKYLTEDNSTLSETKEKINSYKKKIEAIEDKSSNNELSKFFINLENFPDAYREYAILDMQLTIQKSIFEILYPQYESSKLQEMKDIPTIDIIDSAYVPGFRTKPKRMIICIISFLLSLFLSSGYTLIKDKIIVK